MNLQARDVVQGRERNADFALEIVSAWRVQDHTSHMRPGRRSHSTRLGLSQQPEGTFDLRGEACGAR